MRERGTESKASKTTSDRIFDEMKKLQQHERVKTHKLLFSISKKLFSSSVCVCVCARVCVCGPVFHDHDYVDSKRQHRP